MLQAGFYFSTGGMLIKSVRVFPPSVILDRAVIDEIGESLVHLLRNAVDHGIETPDARLTLGTWQQIVLVDFDTAPRTITVVCQIIGE